MLNAEAGESSSSTSLGSPSSHPSYPAVAPLCRRYPTQASAVFQTYLDLKNGAAAWDIVEPLALSTAPQTHLNAPNERVEKDLSSLSDAEAEALVQERLERLNKGVARLGLVNSSEKGAEAEHEEEEQLKPGLAAIKGRRKDAVSRT